MSKAHPYSKTATPVVIAGAPRSGTTFLTVSLNAHPQIVITNELRIWSVFNDVRLKTREVSELLPDHPLRDRFRADLMRSMKKLFTDFYRRHVDKTNAGCPTEAGSSVEPVIKAFGDKNPGYADSHNRGCIDYIAKTLPGAKFIHIVRDPRSCVASYKNIDIYSDDISRCVSIWQRHASTMAKVADRIGADRVLEFRYEDYVGEHGEDWLRRIETHLGVDHADEPAALLKRERNMRVPYRSPVTPQGKLGSTSYQDRLTPEEIAAVEKTCAVLMRRYGYTPSA